MPKTKERLAAVLINHAYVVEQSLATGRRSRRPTSSRYKEIATLDISNAELVNEVMKSFIAFNSKHFIENTRFKTDKLVFDTQQIKTSWSPKILARGLSGRLVADGTEFALASSIASALAFSRQSPEISSALELAGNISPFEQTNTSIDFTIPSFKTSPFCDLEREHNDFSKLLEAKLLLIQAIAFAARTMTKEQVTSVINGSVNIQIVTESKDGQTCPLSLSIEETDNARAQRLARERLEDLRRRRTMLITAVTVGNNSLTYDVSPVIAPDEHQQISINTDTLFGW